MAPLLALPPEILQSIICCLDPISLIALSQTSAKLRALINPTRHDFTRRLLALELMPEHGGIVPLFLDRGNKLFPPWDSDEWERNKYACCGCMRLLPHMMFDNPSILRLPYRKPPPGSVEARKATATDWEPLEPKARWRRIQERTDQERNEQEKRRGLVRMQERALQANAALHPFAVLDRTREVAALREAEIYLAGTSRHRRRCIECKRLRGDWSQPDRHRGSKEVPVVVSRQLGFTDRPERYFPGLVESLPLEMAPRAWSVYREDAKTCLFTLYVVWCASCGTWQEQGAFRWWNPFRPEPPTGPLLCNHCHLKAHQDPALLARELSNGVLDMLRDRVALLFGRLGFGWRILDQDFNFTAIHRSNAPLQSYSSVGEEILYGIRWYGVSPTYQEAIFEESELPDLRRRLHRFRDFIYNEVEESVRETVLQSWFRLWVEDYDLFEGEYYWLKEQISRLESDPYMVLNYVLERDPYRIQPCSLAALK